MSSFEYEKNHVIDFEKSTQEHLGFLEVSVSLFHFLPSPGFFQFTHAVMHRILSSTTTTTPTLTRRPRHSKMSRHTPKSGPRLPIQMTPPCLCLLSVLGSSVSSGPSSFLESINSSSSDTLLSASARFVFHGALSRFRPLIEAKSYPK